MNTPPFLIAAALLFWGWQTDLLWLGAVAATVLEGSRWLRVRWDFSQGDLDRIWNFCVLLFFGVAIFAFASNDGVDSITSLVKNRNFAERSEALNKGARSVLLFFQWTPLTFLPIALAQAFGRRDRMDWSTFSWWLRRQRREFSSAPEIRNSRSAIRNRPESSNVDRHSQDSGLNVLWPFFAACLFAASAANERTFRFPIGLTLLVGWALWANRPRRMSALNWSACWVVTAFLAVCGVEGLLLLRGAVQRFESSLVARFASGRNFDPRESRTMLGTVGRLKQSGRIVMRVETDGQPPPELLREASYTQFKSPHWVATKRDFANLPPESDETTWKLLRKKSTKRQATIANLLPGGEGLLALPLGAGRLEDLPAFVLETNRLGAVRVASGPGYARFRAAYDDGPSIDSPPDADDSELPIAERQTLKQIAEQLNLSRLKPEEAVQALGAFFSREFSYSTWLRADQREAADQTALAAFLLKNRSGHCEYFATATVLLLRQIGVPARYAVGYSVQERKGRQWVVRERHAHAWCLAWVNGAWRDVDTTPAGWNEIEAARASPWERFSDAWTWVRFAIGEWRWGKGGWKQYLIWLIVPVLLFAGWRLLSKKQWKRTDQNRAQEQTLRAWPGLDSEFYLVERKLAELGLERQSSETPVAWLNRIAGTGTVGLAELQPLLAGHYRLRFDPKGLSNEERTALKETAATWLNRNFGDDHDGHRTNRTQQ